MNAVIRWEEPPERRRKGRPSTYVPIAAQLRANAGRWALVFDGAKPSATTTAWQFRTGKVDAFLPVSDFEFEVRTHGVDGKIYARYVGEAGHG